MKIGPLSPKILAKTKSKTFANAHITDLRQLAVRPLLLFARLSHRTAFGRLSLATARTHRASDRAESHAALLLTTASYALYLPTNLIGLCIFIFFWFAFSMSCAACSTAILLDEDSLRCALDGCRKMYHLLCAGGKRPSDSANAWVCPECSCAARRGGDNSLTPVGTSKTLRDPNVTYRKVIPVAGTGKILNKKTDPLTEEQATTRIEKDQHDHETDLPTEIRSLRQDILLLKDQLSAAVTIILSYETKLERYATHVQSLHEKIEQNYARSPLADSRQFRLAVSPSEGSAEPPKLVHKKVVKKNAQVGIFRVPPTPGENSRVPNGVVKQSVAADNQSVDAGNQSVAAVNTNEPRVAINPGVLAVDTQQQPWTEVRKRSRRPPSLCGTAGPAITSLKAVEARTFIHLWNMESSADDIRSYLHQLCPVGTCTVEELTARGNYKSYKLGVPAVYTETCLSTEVWPVNARLKTWITYRQPSGPQKRMDNDRPFRGSAATQ